MHIHDTAMQLATIRQGELLRGARRHRIARFARLAGRRRTGAAAAQNTTTTIEGA